MDFYPNTIGDFLKGIEVFQFKTKLCWLTEDRLHQERTMVDEMIFRKDYKERNWWFSKQNKRKITCRADNG